MSLTSAAVREVVFGCFYDDPVIDSEEKLPQDAVRVEGITRCFAFDPVKVGTHKARIRELLAHLPPQFFKSSGSGGGWSFLSACMDNAGNLWGDQLSVEELFVLGQAAGFVSCPLPRGLWAALPGGVPYYVVDLPKL